MLQPAGGLRGCHLARQQPKRQAAAGTDSIRVLPLHQHPHGPLHQAPATQLQQQQRQESGVRRSSTGRRRLRPPRLAMWVVVPQGALMLMLPAWGSAHC